MESLIQRESKIKMSNSQAQAPPEERVVASFPDPPSSLYKVYTDENVRSGQAPKPPALIKGKYYMFGCPFDVSLHRVTYLLLDHPTRVLHILRQRML